MQVKLKSDFHDFYDYQFDREGFPFLRMSKDGLTRSHMFQTMKTWGLTTPIFGICKDMGKYFGEDYKVVVYTDEQQHCGEGKILLDYKSALDQYPTHLISEYLKGDKTSCSLRYLSIGNAAYILSYNSDDEWRSNNGNVDIKVEKQLGMVNQTLTNHPLFAIDFIKDSDAFYAIDFNSAPRPKGNRHRRPVKT